jgi:hypothetical protein
VSQTGRPPGPSVEHSIEINVPAEFIWEMLEDVDSWSSWNPIYRTANGSIGLGDRIDMTVALPRMKPQKVAATVARSNPNTELHYGSPALGGLVNAMRYVEIEPTGPQSCIVTNGEAMSGLLGRLLARGVGPRVREALQQMNEALKPTAESRWQQRSRAED